MTEGSTLRLRFSDKSPLGKLLIYGYARPTLALATLLLAVLALARKVLSKLVDRFASSLDARRGINLLGQLATQSYSLVSRISHKTETLTRRFEKSAANQGLIGGENSVEGQLYRRYHTRLTALMPLMPYQPKISVLMPVYDVDHRFLKEALGSVAAQIYQNWELCAVDDASKDSEIWKILESFAAAHPGRVKLARNAQNQHISGTSNRALELATGDYVTLLDHDDRLYPHSLAEVVRHISAFDKPEILYSDSGAIDESGHLAGTTFFKPDWSPFMHLAFNYTTHLSVYRTDLLRQIGGFRLGYEGSQDYDLMLRAVEATKKPVAHIPICLYQWRIHAKSTAQGIEAKPYAATAAVKALSEACARRGRSAEVEFEPGIEHYRIRFALPNPLPLISIIIPTKNRFELLNSCLSSIFAKTSYMNYEVIVVDNGSDDRRCRNLYAELADQHPRRFSVIDEPGPFNFAIMNNRAVGAANGDYVVLLNNDTEILTPEWLDELLRYAQFPEVGAVGAQLLFPSGNIQHAGLVLLDSLIAASAFERHPATSSFYYNLINTARETCAVTAACLMVQKTKYLAVGGLDEVALPNGYGDVDFCLKLRKIGLSNVYTPYAKALHFESASRGPCIETFERHEMMRRWGSLLMNDPYLNPNLKRSKHFEQGSRPITNIEGVAFRRYLLQSAWFASTQAVSS